MLPRSKLPEIMNFIQACSKRVNLRTSNVFHAGDGNMHPLILFDEREHGIGVEKSVSWSSSSLHQT
ncbi:MAG TPA: hypothetical protein DHV39_17675 [Verrucomicrobiales bacterium]|nr:hypothetical protein [Verrucomicrobiales bacterium]HCZ05219.1 hypothetical protein [Verrucomicrobiales bacterium]